MMSPRTAAHDQNGDGGCDRYDLVEHSPQIATARTNLIHMSTEMLVDAAVAEFGLARPRELVHKQESRLLVGAGASLAGWK
jgi:hypothetical protein